MHVPNVLALAALAGSVVMLLAAPRRQRTLAIVATVASGLEVLMSAGVSALQRVPLIGLVLAVALAVAGVMLYLRSSGKRPVTAATVVALVGSLQVLAALGVV